MACASGHSGKSSGVVSNRLVSLKAVGGLIGVGGGSGKGEIILLTLEGSGTEVLGGVDSWLFPIAILPLGTTEFVFSSSYELTWFFEGASPRL